MSSSHKSHQPQHSLVVDDDLAICKALDKKFTDAGSIVTVCHNGDDALRMLREQRFDFILIDLMMPGQNGFAILKQLNQTQNADTPVFVLTAFSEKCGEALTFGARRCFIKTDMGLREVVTSVLNIVRNGSESSDHT